MGKGRGTTPGIGAQTSAGDAAASVVGARLREVAKLLPRAAERAGRAESEEAVHALRVATRRAAAALRVFEGIIDERGLAKSLKRLKRIRRAAGAVRDLDVQAGLLEAAAKRSTGAAAGALRTLASATRKSRRPMMAEIAKLAERWPRRELRVKAEKLTAGIGREGEGAMLLCEVMRGAMEREAARVREASAENLREIEHLHALRLELKRLRYTVEIAGLCMDREHRKAALGMLSGVQTMLGEINDDAILVERLRAAPRQERGRLRSVIEATSRALAKRHAAFLDEWARLLAGGWLERLTGSIADSSVPPLPGIVPGGFVEAKPLGMNGTHKSARGGVRGGERGRSGAGGKSRRLAAIDVGTNSVRLIVAEAQPDGTYRILDDEKEITRLGKGLGATGKLDAGAIEHSAVTIARMRSIAEGYGAGEVRVVGTSAAREAKNTKELTRAIREKAGLQLEVISGEQEAVLAYRSAARAFDLSRIAGAVVDIGGGSTEIVLSAPGGLNGMGLIERVYTLPLGAVRLTEKFGGADACSRERFEEMRKHIKGMLETKVGKPPVTPPMMIGTGGTFTTLGAMVQLRELGPTADGLFSGGVQGIEVGRADLKHLLEYVRKLPVKERTRVAGLSADRADIIVAGLAIVDGVLKWFGSNRVRVHEGGIRDGILLGMVGGGEGEPGERRDPMRAVRRLARACAYEAAHSKHVTGLALSIFDQLRDAGERVKLEKGMRLDAEARLLLEAASLLHDIGYLINYAQHHKHSYHLIVHADLGGLTTRQVRVVANVARYHRAAEPKEKHPTFAALTPEDRALVRGLSGILRVADGLDRTHMQSVRGVDVKARGAATRFDIEAEREPSVDMWGAVRKCELFERAFSTKCGFEWRCQSGQAEKRREGAVGCGQKRIGLGVAEGRPSNTL